MHIVDGVLFDEKHYEEYLMGLIEPIDIAQWRPERIVDEPKFLAYLERLEMTP